jgi:hypothetical protein
MLRSLTSEKLRSPWLVRVGLLAALLLASGAGEKWAG